MSNPLVKILLLPLITKGTQTESWLKKMYNNLSIINIFFLNIVSKIKLNKQEKENKTKTFPLIT